MKQESHHMPLVSVTMPFHNAERYLESAIQSVIAQTYPAIELVLCNDGSTDKSEDIVHSFRNERIIYVKNDSKMGISFSRNMCLTHSKGSFIAVLDSDDIALPNRIALQLKFLQDHPDAILCGTHFTQFDDDGLMPKREDKVSTDIEIRTQFLFSNCILHSTLMFRWDPARKILYDEKMEVCEDFDFINRLGQLGKMSILPEVSTYYRLHKKNTSIKQKEKMAQYMRIMFDRILSDWMIPHSPAELELHARFLQTEFEHFSDSSSKDALVRWIQHLQHHTINNPNIIHSLVEKNISERWFDICLKNRDWKGMARFAIMSKYKNGLPRFFFNKINYKYQRIASIIKGEGERKMTLTHNQSNM